MEPLDLRQAPPREPRAELAGIIFLPRSIDKVRASLPGGSLGEYSVTGFTTQMLEMLGLPVDVFVAIVADAPSDDHVGTYVTTHSDENSRTAWHDYIAQRLIYNGDRAEAIADFPFLADRPDIVYSLDLLAEDDRRSFPRP